MIFTIYSITLSIVTTIKHGITITNNRCIHSLLHLYKYIISKFNKKLVKKVLEGKEFYLGYKLGTISIRRIERNFDKKSVNYFETKKLKAQGIDKVVYYTDDHWFRWYWAKRRCKVPNKSVYKFSPTSGPNGIKRALSTLIQEDEFAFLNFVK